MIIISCIVVLSGLVTFACLDAWQNSNVCKILGVLSVSVSMLAFIDTIGYIRNELLSIAVCLTILMIMPLVKVKWGSHVVKGLTVLVCLLMAVILIICVLKTVQQS